MANSHSPSSGELEGLRWQLRAYELSLDRAKRKRLGQFFTGPRASSLLAALSIQGAERSLVDPMAGHGDLLDAAAARLTGFGHRVSLTGVEIDAPTAELASRRLALCAAQGGHTANVMHSDAFTPDLWKDDRAVGSFDLVITNPPYVRYQAHSDARKRHGLGVTATDARSALRTIAQDVADPEEYPIWSALIEGYSGLADLSVPSWLLCAMLVKPGGILGLVVPKTWMNRDYASVIQYLQLRFFKPLIVVEEHGIGWFQDALVPTTLVVSRRRESQDAMIPLSERAEMDGATIVAAIRPMVSDNRSLVGRAFPGPDPDAAFTDWLRTTASHATGDITVRHVSLAEQRQALIARCRREPWLRGAGETASVQSRRSSTPPIPTVMQPVIGALRTTTLTTIERLGYQVGQGLRTGCNAFFYVEAAGPATGAAQPVRLNDALGGEVILVPIALLQPVVRRQSDIPGFAVDPARIAGRVLVLHGWGLPEEAVAAGLKSFPDSIARLVRRAATTAVGPAERRVLIPHLSAVRTNGRSHQASNALFPEIGASRHWYMLPEFAPRHLPALFVARVNSDTPSFLMNTRTPMLVDANFSTIYGHSNDCPPLALLALLNSTWCRACAECIGTPMGGGALKLEATQLRELPVPALDGEAISRLAEIGDALSTRTTSRLDDMTPAIDAIVLRSLVSVPSEADSIRDRLLSLIAERREQRTRVTKGMLL